MNKTYLSRLAGLVSFGAAISLSAVSFNSAWSCPGGKPGQKCAHEDSTANVEKKDALSCACSKKKGKKAKVCNCDKTHHESHAAKKAPENGQEVTLFVKGMHCGGCAHMVSKLLKDAGLPEDQILEVKLGEAHVWFKKDGFDAEKTPCEVLSKVAKDSDYKFFLDKDLKKECSANI